MSAVAPDLPPKRSTARRWISRGFLAWAVFSSIWLANSYRTQGDEALARAARAMAAHPGITGWVVAAVRWRHALPMAACTAPLRWY